MTDNLNFSVENIEENYNNITENSTTEIIGYTDFNRVNFDDPTSILSYGAELIDEIGNYQMEVARLKKFDVANLDIALEKIGKAMEFKDELAKEETETATALVDSSKAKQMIMAVTKGAKKLFGIDNDETPKSYLEQYENISDQITTAASAIETEKNNALVNIKINSEYVRAMKVYAERLKKIIEVGEADLDNYKDIVLAMEEEFNLAPDDEKKYKFNMGKKNIEYFTQRLEDLKEQLSMYWFRIEEEQITQAGNMQLVVQYKRYVSNEVPMVLAQASSMIDVKIQKQNVAKFNQCIEMTNEAFKKNAEMLVGNIEEIKDLAKQGNIKTETFEYLNATLEQGYKLLKNAKQEIEIEQAKKAAVVDKILEASSRRTVETIGIGYQGLDALPDSFESHKYPVISDNDKPRQKTFGIFKSGK